jgi:hypothetical protein
MIGQPGEPETYGELAELVGPNVEVGVVVLLLKLGE